MKVKKAVSGPIPPVKCHDSCKHRLVSFMTLGTGVNQMVCYGFKIVGFYNKPYRFRDLRNRADNQKQHV